MFSVTVTGTFTYTGSSSTCTKSIASATSKNANWKISSKSASKSGNKATAKATAKRYVDGTAVETQNCTVTLTCSSNGSLSYKHYFRIKHNFHQLNFLLLIQSYYLFCYT